MAGILPDGRDPAGKPLARDLPADPFQSSRSSLIATDTER
jgi:hypothetical protein